LYFYWIYRSRDVAGFRITIFDNRTRGDVPKPRLERVVVGADDFLIFGHDVVFLKTPKHGA